MKIISVILISIGIIFGMFGIRSYMRDNAYAEASIVVKASVKSAEIKPNPWKAVGSIKTVLTYMRDGVADSLEYHFTEAYTINDSLPTEDEIKATSFYVRYVPAETRSERIPNWVIVNNNGEFQGWYGQSQFGQMFNFVLIGYMIRMFARKKPTYRS